MLVSILSQNFRVATVTLAVWPVIVKKLLELAITFPTKVVAPLPVKERTWSALIAIVLAVTLAWDPVIGIILFNTKVIFPKFVFNSNPIISTLLAVPVATSPTDTSKAISAPVWIVIDPPAWIEINPKFAVNDCPLIVTLASLSTITLFKDIFANWPLIEISALAIVITSPTLAVSWVKVEIAKIFPVPVRTAPWPMFQAPLDHSSAFQ